MGDRGRRGEAVGGIDADVDAVGDEDLQRRAEGRLREGVSVAPDEERPVVALRLAVAADRLRRGEDVGLVECGAEGRAAMAGGAEGDPLGGVGGVGAELVVGPQQSVDVDELGGIGGLSGARALGHGWPRRVGVAAHVATVGPHHTRAGHAAGRAGERPRRGRRGPAGDGGGRPGRPSRAAVAGPAAGGQSHTRILYENGDRRDHPIDERRVPGPLAPPPARRLGDARGAAPPGRGGDGDGTLASRARGRRGRRLPRRRHGPGLAASAAAALVRAVARRLRGGLRHLLARPRGRLPGPPARGHDRRAGRAPRGRRGPPRDAPRSCQQPRPDRHRDRPRPRGRLGVGSAGTPRRSPPRRPSPPATSWGRSSWSAR